MEGTAPMSFATINWSRGNNENHAEMANLRRETIKDLTVERNMRPHGASRE